MFHNNSIYFSANRVENWEYDFRNSEIYNVDIYSKTITLLTSQIGPDFSPKVPILTQPTSSPA